MYWERTLQRHFPSFYLHHLDDYNKVSNTAGDIGGQSLINVIRPLLQRMDVSWKHEYKEAYQSMALRYMDGANLQQSRVVHFGPTLGKKKKWKGERKTDSRRRLTSVHR